MSHHHIATHRRAELPPPLTTGATTNPDLTITLGLDDHGHLTAAPDQPSPAADHALVLLGFTRPRGQRLHLLDVSPGQRSDVATTCARLLTEAGYEVAAMPALVPDPDRPPDQTPGPEPLRGDPTVVITRHPVLGITATTADPGHGDTHRLITRSGFHYLPSHSLYVLPFDIPHDQALAAATELADYLGAHHVPATVSPAIHHPLPGQRLTSQAPEAAAPRRRQNHRWTTRVAQLLRAAANRLVPEPSNPPTPPALSEGTAWVQVPLRGHAPRWTPPAALPPAPGMLLRTHAARTFTSLCSAPGPAAPTVHHDGHGTSPARRKR
ncbi:hypothetical protein [Streptacidiphilus fuscans]|uniref:Uncharacterized protein n=1 Tax=Streptacidiphilus fuscans TaxID=2789292 RepID=A0A931B7B5_9ACTN|nr:hypothetical protein [Streptacidiphilus fuscans]MBF9071754.1 hypothetical protein [Streptacidiphilus fuscans]